LASQLFPKGLEETFGDSWNDILQSKRPSWCLTNSVKALKAQGQRYNVEKYYFFVEIYN